MCSKKKQPLAELFAYQNHNGHGSHLVRAKYIIIYIK